MSAPPIDRERLQGLAVSDSGFVFDPRTGQSYNVNATGLAILRALKEGLEPAAIAAGLAKEFDVNGHPLEDDVEAFLALLREQGLAAKPPAPADDA